jgi:adenylylsulfate kinase-like enzyme
MTASLDDCRLRDAKRLYARFADGQLRGVPGEDASYEAPEFPEVTASGGEDDAALFRIVQSLLAANRAP